MAKKDVYNDNLLSWDEYKDKPIEKALASIYSHAENFSKKMCKWYWDSIKLKRRASTRIKFWTLVLLIIGTILPIGSGLGNDAGFRLQLTQFGVIALAISGLLQISDRIFGLSSGWLRYTKTVMEMENLTRKFELEWASYIIKDSNINKADVKSLFDIAKKFEDDIAKLEIEETDKWVTEFNTSTALLNDLIKSKREAAEAAIKTAEENDKKSKSKGSVEVAIAQTTPPVPFNIEIDDAVIERAFLGSYWSKHELEPGHHTLAIKTISDSPQIIKKIIDVPPGEIFKAKIELF